MSKELNSIFCTEYLPDMSESELGAKILIQSCFKDLIIDAKSSRFISFDEDMNKIIGVLRAYSIIGFLLDDLYFRLLHLVFLIKRKFF